MSRDLNIGGVFRHPVDGVIYVTGGAYEIGGRVSNHWRWRKVNKDGTLGEEGHGYGGHWKRLDAKISIIVEVI